MRAQSVKGQGRKIRHLRIRKKVEGNHAQPRFSIYRGNRHIYVQIIDDTKGNTLVSASSLSPEIRDKIKGFTLDTAKEVGVLLARKAKEKGIEKVVFDRGGYKYHGKIKALADAARTEGLKF
ncbi:MAG: 50S ribosomal protein L18 [Deltaproteobacteria bacterium]|nr:50S ribosomal protein L18 [Deltaproteobacteria bacterium]